jgi:ribosomal protein S18 acetylase RimI-like enzyme
MSWLIKAVAEHDGVCLLAEIENQSVGLICGWIEPPDEQVMDKDEPAFGYISEGIVTEKFRRYGVYQKLVDAMHTYFVERNINVVRTVATAGNVNVATFLAKNGFAPYYTCFEKRIG